MGDEQTYVFVIEPVKHIDNDCYSTHLYRPLLLPFVSTYDDYGSGEHSAGCGFDMIMNAIKLQLVEVEQGKNKYHDIAVTKQDWCEKLFFDSIRENRLSIKTHKGIVNPNFVMMRKDIVDELINTYEFEEYVGQDKGNHGYGNSYVKYRMLDVFADIDAFFAHMQRIAQEKSWKLPRMDMIACEILESNSVVNRVAQWMNVDLGPRYSRIVDIRGDLVEIILANNLVRAKELMIDHLKGMFVDKFMEITRKSWIPGGHEGSQQNDFAPYQALMECMENYMLRVESEFDEEMEDDEV
jgi:hypothetical protein